MGRHVFDPNILSNTKVEKALTKINKTNLFIFIS